MGKDKKDGKNKLTARQTEVLEAYIDLVESGIYFPTRTDLKVYGISRDTIRACFGNLTKLREIAKKSNPDAFSGAIEIDDYISDKYLKTLDKNIKKYKRFFISTAVSGQQAHSNFIKNIKLFCDHNKAKFLVLPSHDPAHNLDNEIDWHFDPDLLNDTIVFEETFLNLNFFISGIRITAKQINPIMGLTQLSQSKGSFVSASPKQFLEYDSVSADKLPHARMTPGACTLPNYKTSKGNSLRTGYLAQMQHTVGGIIVEIEDDRIFHFRQVQADVDGSFCDLGLKYHNNKITKEIPILIMGDLHAGEHDETAVRAWTEIINELGVEEVAFHDVFNAVSVNPHEEQNFLLRAERASKGLNSLVNELKITSEQIDRILNLKSIKKGIIVKSNHDDMLDRWVKKGKFTQDPVNFKIGVDLASRLIDTDKDYLKEALELVCLPKNHKKIKWLKVDEDYIVGGVNLSAHGDKGANGARGNIINLAKALGKAVVGHSHTPGIYRGIFQVGTTSLLRLGYNKGPSSWVHCSCLLYKNGQRQLINSIKGSWRLK